MDVSRNNTLYDKVAYDYLALDYFMNDDNDDTS